MSKFTEVLDRLDKNQNYAYSLIRIFLGIALFVRGLILISNPEALVELASPEKFTVWYSYIAIGHLFGGLFLALGLFTRIGALFQIPILVGAVFLVHERRLLNGDQSVELAALVLFLLILCFVFGSGRYSVGKRVNLPYL